LLPFALAIKDHWQPIKTVSTITLIISQNGLTFSEITIIGLILIIIVYLLEIRKQRKLNNNTYQKLSSPNKKIIKAVYETQKNIQPTLTAIKNTYTRMTEENIEEEILMEKILELKNTRILKSYIINNQDMPIRIWKAELN
jgi:hypothetical protein